MFQLTEDQSAIQKTAREFARKEMMPLAAKHDQTMEYPTEIIKKAHETGLVNISVPESMGGPGLDHLTQTIIVEELSYGCSGMATAITTNDLALGPVFLSANSEQVDEFIRPMFNAPLMAAYCVTEPGAGSDVAGIRTTAKRDGDGYLLNGEKINSQN